VNRRLSSLLVPVYKAIPFFVGAVTVLNILREPRGLLSFGFLFLTGFTLVWFFLTYRWKWVFIRGEKRYVSNFFQAIEVPVGDVEWIQGTSFWGMQPQTVSIELKTPTRFGSQISFIPAGGVLWAERWAKNMQCELGLEHDR